MSFESLTILLVVTALMVYLVYALLKPEKFDMALNGWFQILLFFAAVLAVTKPMGIFMARVFSGEKTFFC